MARTPQTAEQRIHKIVRRPNVERVVATFTSGGVSLRVIPNSFHPLVASRREAALAKKSEWGISEVQAVNEASLAPVAEVFAGALEEAVSMAEAAIAKAEGK